LLSDKSTSFNPIIVTPVILSSDCLKIIPEPRSILNENLGSPKEMYRTSASLSYSQLINFTSPNFNLSIPTFNSSIILFFFLNNLYNKQLEQNHPYLLLLCMQQQDIYPLLQECCDISLLQEENRHPLFASQKEGIPNTRFC